MEQPNLGYIEEIAGGDPTIVAQFVEIIKKEFPLELEQYHKLIGSKDSANAAALVHKLKHKISILGLSEGYQLAVAHEDALKNADFELSPKFVEVLETITLFLTPNK